MAATVVAVTACGGDGSADDDSADAEPAPTTSTADETETVAGPNRSDDPVDRAVGEVAATDDCDELGAVVVELGLDESTLLELHGQDLDRLQALDVAIEDQLDALGCGDVECVVYAAIQELADRALGEDC